MPKSGICVVFEQAKVVRFGSLSGILYANFPPNGYFQAPFSIKAKGAKLRGTGDFVRTFPIWLRRSSLARGTNYSTSTTCNNKHQLEP